MPSPSAPAPSVPPTPPLRRFDGKVVIVSLNGELTVKRFHQAKGKSWLLPENPDYPPISLNEEDETHLWGVVTNVIHPL